MGISVNGIDIDDRLIEQELPHHQGAANPLKRSVHEVVLRTVLLQEAERLGVEGQDEDARIEALLAREVQVPQADLPACETYYRNHARRFTRGEMVEARHILFQVTSTVSLDFIRETAAAVLEAIQEHPERFGELAAQYSNCPSGAVGGSLGQLGRGDSVPEFDDVLFRLNAGAIAPHLVETRFGLHIVQVARRIDGILLPFDAVKSQIAAYLTTASWQRGVHQYLQVLVGRARIEGVTLEGASSPLVQ